MMVSLPPLGAGLDRHLRAQGATTLLQARTSRSAPREEVLHRRQRPFINFDTSRSVYPHRQSARRKHARSSICWDGERKERRGRARSAPPLTISRTGARGQAGAQMLTALLSVRPLAAGLVRHAELTANQPLDPFAVPSGFRSSR